MDKTIVIIGAGGHGKVVADIARCCGYTRLIFLDDYAAACGCDPVCGTVQDAVRYNGSDFVVAIGNGRVRQQLQTSLQAQGLRPATLVHPRAVVADDVIVGEGTVVMAGAVINPGAVVGTGCIVNTCSSVDHDCIVENYVHISVGAHVAGTVSVGCRTWIGAGAVVSNNVTITADCMIGAGAVVVKSIAEPGVYVGVPAARLR